jgi:hypothetical protein
MMAITWRRLGSLMMMMMAIVFFGIAEGAWRGKKSDANSEHLQVPSPVSDEVPAIMCDVRIVTGDERRRAGKLGVGAGRGNLSLEISPNLPSLHQTDNGVHFGRVHNGAPHRSARRRCPVPKLNSSQVWTLSATCNVIYCLLMLAGFVFVPRNIMLVVGLLTATIGDAQLVQISAAPPRVSDEWRPLRIQVQPWCW